MRDLLIATLILALSAITATAQAQNESSTLCIRGYAVYFGNGIKTEVTGAYAGTSRVENMLGAEYGGEPIDVESSFNPTEGVLTDLVEVFKQKIAEDPTLSWQLFFRWVSGSFINSTLTVAIEDYFETRGSAHFSEALSRLSSSELYTDRTALNHARTYEEALLAGKRVMVVSHSQGNLYANAAYQIMQSHDNGVYDLNAFGIAAVATPANSVATSDGYVTSDTDHIIDLARVAAPQVLPANDFSVPFTTSADRFGHGFKDIYTNGQFAIRGHVLNVMRNTLNRIATATVTGNGGPITATLHWSQPGDVDLHTFEPNAHVYYAARQGNNGYLDRDDTQGTGPEHYYTSCEGFQTGNYAFGVNYYGGTATEEAVVKISVLGVSYPAGTVTLVTAEGSAGNNNPQIMFGVLITEDEDGVYHADVNRASGVDSP